MTAVFVKYQNVAFLLANRDFTPKKKKLFTNFDKNIFGINRNCISESDDVTNEPKKQPHSSVYVFFLSTDPFIILRKAVAKPIRDAPPNSKQK